MDVLLEFFGGAGAAQLDELKAMAFLLFGMSNWTYHWYDPKGSINPEKLSRIACTVFMKGITERRKELKEGRHP